MKSIFFKLHLFSFINLIFKQKYICFINNDLSNSIFSSKIIRLIKTIELKGKFPGKTIKEQNHENHKKIFLKKKKIQESKGMYQSYKTFIVEVKKLLSNVFFIDHSRLTNVEHLQPSHWNAPAKRSIDGTSMNSYHFPSERKRRGWNNWTIGNASTLVSDRFLATRRGILVDASPCQKDACLQCLTMKSTEWIQIATARLSF